MIDDHLMPSGEPNSTRRDRNLEILGGTTRLELGLGGVARVLRRRGLLLLGIFLLGFALIYAASSQLPKRYSSVAWIKINDSTQALFTDAGKSVDLTKEQRAVILSLQSPKLSDAVESKLGRNFRDVKSVTSTGLEASPLIRIDSSAATPRIAERAANATAEYAVGARRRIARAELLKDAVTDDGRAAELTVEVDELSSDLQGTVTTDPKYASKRARLDAKTAELTEIVKKASQERSTAETADGGLEIYETASRPTQPVFPQPTSWAILGGLAILLVSVGIVYGREELVGRFRSGDSSESRRAGARVLGVLPAPDSALPRGVVTGAGATVDEVGLQIVHLLGRSKANVVLLCGVDGAAPEYTTRRVAQAIAESGARVVYAACRGVSDSGSDDEFEAPVPRARLSVVHEQQTGGRLRVLDDGIAVNELTVARARTVLRRLTEQCEYVVIAAPSPTVEPSSLVLAELADATVMIAQHGVTKLRDAERAGTRLRRVGGAVLGVLVDPVKPVPVGASFVPRASGVSAG